MQHKQDSRDQAQNMDNHAQNNGQVFDIQNNGKVFAAQNNGQVFATQSNGQVFATQNNGQVFAEQNKGQIFAAQNNGQVFATQNNGQVFATQNNGQVFATQNNGQVFATQNNGQVFATQNNGQVFATQNNGQVFATQNNGQVFATQNNGQVFDTQNNGLAFATQNNGQEFDTQFPFVDQEPPRPTYPPPYTTFPQQQNVSATGVCRSIFVGRISIIWLGSLLVVFGAMSEAAAIVAFQFSAGLSEIRAGIWCGCLIISCGSVAIATGRRETRKLIIRTIVSSAIAIVASVIQIAIAGTGLTSDIDSYSCYPPCDPYAHWQNCPCYYNDWRKSAITTNGIMVGAAVFAFIVALWILVVTCIAIRRNPAGFQDVSAQVLANAALHNLYENSPHQQVMDMPPSYIPMQTIPNQQMHAVPVQYGLQQQYQQQMPLSYLQPNTTNPSTFPAQGQENYAFTQEHADDDRKAFESKWK